MNRKLRKVNVLPVIIPCLEPNEKLIKIVSELTEKNLSPIIVVNDGSSAVYDHFFEQVQNQYGCILLKHPTNMGKGRALKDAFDYCLNRWPDLIGCVTADSDGQHSAESISRCGEALLNQPHSLVLGVRDFTDENVPLKSRLGNNLTRKICRLLCGINVSDTQTGLRGIPADFMRHLLSVPGERFEFETRMLLEARNQCSIIEVTIETIYDLKENHATHFDPVKDSIRIYKIFAGELVKFFVSSVSSSIVDLTLFAVFCELLISKSTVYVAIATVFARAVSAIYNYLINYWIVFSSREKHKRSATRYFILAFLQMLCSAGLTTGLVARLPWMSELAIKIPVDTVLFFISFCIQREFIYKK